MTTDYTQAVIDALNTGWTKINTSDRKPTIVKIITLTDFNLSGGDFCGVYAGDETDEQRFIGYPAVKVTRAISFNLSTAVSHAHLIAMKEEARRVAHQQRKTLITGGLWHWRRAIDVSDKRRGTFKYVCDTVVEIQSEMLVS